MSGRKNPLQKTEGGKMSMWYVISLRRINFIPRGTVFQVKSYSWNRMFLVSERGWGLELNSPEFWVRYFGLPFHL